MRHRIAVAATLAMTLFAAVACGDDEPATPGANDLDGTGKTLKVWLMVDAQSAWQNVVDETNAKFKEATKADVNVEYQQWTNHLTKLDATLSGSDVPDVVELGNTEASKYVFSGAFADLSKKKSTFDNNANWLTGLSAPCEDEGKLYCVPYYAGARVLLYRTDLFTGAGLQLPKTYDDVVKAAETLQAKHGASDPQFQAFYAPGQYWYQAMGFVYGKGGQIAVKEGGKWKGTLSEAKAQEGLTAWSDLAKKYSRGDPTANETNLAAIFAQGKTAMVLGNTWEQAAAEAQPTDPNDPKSPKADTVVKGKVATIPMPGFTADKGMPTFLGGSVVGVTSKSKNQALATEWARIFTSTATQEALLAKGTLPNSTSLLDKAAQVKGNEAAAVAAKASWFVPNAPKWADVEKANLLQQMGVDIVTNKKSVADATRETDEKIADILNG